MKSPKLIETTGHMKKNKQKYGELIILGSNGWLPKGDRGRKRSKFVLYKRQNPNGVKKSTQHVVKTPQSSQSALDTKQYSVSFTLTKDQAVIVDYIPDEDTDMFQIGRSSKPPIDFVVLNTVPGDETEDNRKAGKQTISRYACRILADRNTKMCKLYAAGFNSSNNIFLGEFAEKWQDNDNNIDGLTTNGIFIMNPGGSFTSGEAKCGDWWEVSVTGRIFSDRKNQKKGQELEGKTNHLEDGTLIYLCGATLLWRSADGLSQSASNHNVRQQMHKIFTEEPQYLADPNTLTSPNTITGNENQEQPYVYLKCGHVLCNVPEWSQEDDYKTGKCPICFKFSHVVRARLGIETAFYVDFGPPTFAFNPCGHMATEKTVKYWAKIGVPCCDKDGFQPICPFCAIPLTGFPGYIRLIFVKS